MLGVLRTQVRSATEYCLSFAPEGRHVYSLEVPFFTRSSVGAQLLSQVCRRFRHLVSLLKERDLRRALVDINISLLRSESQFNCRTRKLNSLFLLLCLTASCSHADLERATSVSIVNDANPPTFKLDGSGYQIFFLVEENGLTNPRQNRTLWKIVPKEGTRREVWLWPKITYGKVPDGFVQKTPDGGEPPPLLEGRFYSAGGPASDVNGGEIRFTVRNGKIIDADEPVEN